MTLEKIEVLENKVIKMIEVFNRLKDEKNEIENRLKDVTERLNCREKEYVVLEEEKGVVSSKIGKILAELDSIEVLRGEKYE